MDFNKIKSGLTKEFYPFEPKRVSIGLDIGDKSVKMAVLKETPRGTHLLKLAEIELPAKESQTGEEKEAALGSAIAKLIRENNIKAKDVYANLPRESVQIKMLSVPYVPESELRQGLQFEAQQHFTFPLENAIVDYMITGETDGTEGRMLELVVAACPNDVVEKRIGLFQRPGLRPALFGITPLALWYSFEEMKPGDKNKVVALLELEDSQAHVNIFMKGKFHFVRDISLRQPLSGLSYETIEELVTEVSRTFDYYRAQMRVEKIDSLVISGKIEASNLASILGERLGVAVEKANPLKNISVREGAFAPLEVSGKGATAASDDLALTGFTASIGLALMSQKDSTINLLPRRLVREKISLDQKSIPWFAAGLLAVIIFAMQIGILAKKETMKQKRSLLTSRVNEFRQLYNEASIFESGMKDIEQRLAFINSRIEEQKTWPEIFRDISEFIPDELWLTCLKSQYGKKRRTLELRGYGFSNQAAVEFISGLKKIPYFDEAKLNFIRAEEVAKKKVISFEIICQFKETD